VLVVLPFLFFETPYDNYIFLYRLLESWHTKQALLVDIVKSLLVDQSLGIRMALAEVMYLLKLLAVTCPFFVATKQIWIIDNLLWSNTCMQ
jgi:hypothetical protein